MEPTTEEIHERFRRYHVRITPQRVAIYGALAATTSHPTADDLYRTVKRRRPLMSRNTVYYTLAVLRRAGLVHEVNVGHAVARFDANVALHHHLVCLGCQRIVDVMDTQLDHLGINRRQARGFRVVGHRVEFHGYCAACPTIEPPASRPSGR